MSTSASVVRSHALTTARTARPWIRGLARAGFVAKGVEYATIGVFAALAALGDGAGQTTDSKGVLRNIHEQPYGKALLAVMAIGLAGYALWRFVEAILDPEHEAKGAKGALTRIGRFGNGLLHAALVVYAVGLITGAALGEGGGEGGAEARSWTARLLSWDGGSWLVGAVGVGFVLFAANQMKEAWTCKLDEHLDLARMGSTARTWTVQLSRFGIGARAVVFALVGIFLVTAAVRSDSSEAKGLGEVLGAVRSSPLGAPVLGIIAVGLVAYGVYELVEARYRCIKAV